MKYHREYNQIDQIWLNTFLKRLTAESEVFSNFQLTQFNQLVQKLMDLSVKEPEKLQKAISEIIPNLMAIIGDGHVDDGLWESMNLRVNAICNKYFEEDSDDLQSLLNQIRSNDYLVKQLNKIFQSDSINLEQGFKHWREDIDAGSILPDTLRPNLFEIGVNIATTPGDVVFENQLFQLIQYRSTTEAVFANPILIIPAFVNRYYILDLSPENSMVRWLISEGYTVFIISWINPSRLLADYDISHYILDGAMVALDQIDRMFPGVRLQVMGYCAGGVLAAILTALTKSLGDDRISSLTLLATLLDYSEPGPLGQLVTEDSFNSIKKPLIKLGYLPAELLLRTFAALRPYDLLLEPILNSYVMGVRRPPLPLLHWFGDGTRTPTSLVLWMMEQLYLKNRLVKAPAIEIARTKIDLQSITCPVFVFGADRDYISPWQGAFLTASYVSGAATTVLGQGGHNSGVITPPTTEKHHFIMHSDHLLDLSKGERIQSSWWTTWAHWLQCQAGESVPPPMPGGGLRPVLGKAPGSYVTQT